MDFKSTKETDILIEIIMHAHIRLFPKRPTLLKLYLSLHTLQSEMEM